MRSVSMAGRAFMVRPLVGAPAKVRPPAGCRITTFERARVDELARIQHAAYQRTPDASVFPELLSTVGACREHIDSLVTQHPPYGFSTECSVMLVDDGVVRGFCMVSQEPRGAASVDNIAVEPGRRGGAGRALLMESLRRLHAAGSTSVSLTVTCANASAMELYLRCGFVECVRLPVALGARHGR